MEKVLGLDSNPPSRPLRKRKASDATGIGRKLAKRLPASNTTEGVEITRVVPPVDPAPPAPQGAPLEVRITSMEKILGSVVQSIQHLSRQIRAAAGSSAVAPTHGRVGRPASVHRLPQPSESEESDQQDRVSTVSDLSVATGDKLSTKERRVLFLQTKRRWH